MPRFHRRHERERFACDDSGFFMSNALFANATPRGVATSCHSVFDIEGGLQRWVRE